MESLFKKVALLSLVGIATATVWGSSSTLAADKKESISTMTLEKTCGCPDETDFKVLKKHHGIVGEVQFSENETNVRFESGKVFADDEITVTTSVGNCKSTECSSCKNLKVKEDYVKASEGGTIEVTCGGK